MSLDEPKQMKKNVMKPDEATVKPVPMKNEENVAKTSSEKMKPAPTPAPIIPKTDEAVWKKEIRECEAFVQECDLARGIQKLNINHKKWTLVKNAHISTKEKI